MTRPDFRSAVEDLGLLQGLADFDPHVAGTPPLGLTMATSDIDVLCQAADLSSFAQRVWSLYAGQDAFRIWQWVSEGRPLIATFEAHGWVFEIFADRHPVEAQPGWRHFEVERRLLSLGGERLKARVMDLRNAGAKTEPAFWSALHGSGNPYSGMLSLYELPDEALRSILGAAGFTAPA
jgi:hypothetical protein